MGTRTFLEEFYKKVSFGVWGLIMSVIFFGSVIITSLNYIGRDGEAYNPLNHFVSELGELGISSLAIVFNVSLIINGLLFVIFVIGLGLFFDNIFGKIATYIGIFSSITCSAVGIYPMNYLEAHGIAAISFFIGCMITVIIFSLAIYFQKWEKVPKYFSFLGIFAAAFFVVLLISATIDLPYSVFNRPEVWLQPTLEWAAMIAVMSWVILSSLYNILTHYNYKRLWTYTQNFQQKFLKKLRIKLKRTQQISKTFSVLEAQKIGELRGELVENECIVCGKITKSARGLKMHQTSMHKNEKIKMVI